MEQQGMSRKDLEGLIGYAHPGRRGAEPAPRPVDQHDPAPARSARHLGRGAAFGPPGEAEPGDRRRVGYSLRICLIRAIASSTACSGLMPSVATRWTPSARRAPVRPHRAARSPKASCSSRGARPRVRQLHGRAPCGAGRSGPARTAPEQLRHRRQHALAGEVEIVGEPALADQEAHEFLGVVDVAAVLENHGAIDEGLDGEAAGRRRRRASRSSRHSRSSPRAAWP